MKKLAVIFLSVGSLLLAGVSTGAAKALPEESSVILASLSTPFDGGCVDCDPGCGQWGHAAPKDGVTHGPGHGSHTFCWEGQVTCPEGGHNQCGAAPVPVADFSGLVESARQAAVSNTPGAFTSLPAEAAFYVTYNPDRESVQVTSCGGNVVANFPVKWADAWVAEDTQ